MTKHILGLDLGTNSIGWAYIKEAQDKTEQSSIEKIGVRVNLLTVDEQTNFEKGKPITTNAGRTLARSARRNLQRYKLRRENLIKLLKAHQWIDDETILAENGNHSTFQTYTLRSKAAASEVTLQEFARVLLMINKKRGYKSSRKVNTTEEGQLIDGMDIAKKLYDENLTPGQYVYQVLKAGKKKLPDFYRSDLQNEFDKIWRFQQAFYPEILTETFKETLKNKGQKVTSQIFYTVYQFNTAENKGTRNEKKLQAYKWRNEALSKQLTKEEVAYVLAEINGQIYNSSGYLGAISDRSKELYFNKQTVGEYLYEQLQKNPHTRLKNQVFYRQDYLDEFEKIWETQALFHKELTKELKGEIRDVVIFYQRKLKSQKSMVSFCEFEQKEIIVGEKKKTIGLRVASKSSPLFQEFKIWQQLHNIRLRNKETREITNLSQEEKEVLFEELNLKGKLTSGRVLKLIEKGKNYEVNYNEIKGNNSNAMLYTKYLDILDMEGYDIKGELKLKLNKEDISVTDLDVPASEIRDMVTRIFEELNIDTAILNFDPELEGKAFEHQKAYQLWHLLYSYEEDNSVSGMELLYKQLQEKFGFKAEHAKILGSVVFTDDYGSLSTKAMRKIYPFITENEYSAACKLAGYNHSKNSLTKEELANRALKPRLDVLPKNSLRNPVVEKILNQMVNVVNTLIDTENDKLEKAGKERNFRFDEIRVELARELKKNAKEREDLTKEINAAKSKHEVIVKILQKEDGIKNPTRNDIIRYKLYQELKNNGFKNLYTNEYIERKDIFTKKYDIDHIIPQSRLFDDSFSNKTLCPRDVNLDKGNKTAYDYILDKFGQTKAEEFESRVKDLETLGKAEGITKAKYQKLLKQGKDIGDGFIERDLRDSQYIAKKAKTMLFDITRTVTTTSGSVTDRLREDWGLVNVMKELNLLKYRAAGLTEEIETKEGTKKEMITDWTKRNDHRHHAMDALTVAFTKKSFIQYLNNLNARRAEESDGISNTNNRKSIDTNDLRISTKDVLGIEAKETSKVKDELGNWKRVFNEPIPNFRHTAKEHLEQILVSHKAKNKVATKNKNKIAGQKVSQEVLTPRGQLHKETVYGKIRQYASKEEKVSARFDEATIAMVSNPKFRTLLLKRLEENGNDPKKAFTGKNALTKNPIYLDDIKQETLLEKVKLIWLEDNYTIRKEITPELKLDKVIDEGVKRILRKRLEDFNGDAKKAFSDLDLNPIWLNKEKGIAIKRVTISGVSNVEALHIKRNHLGEEIVDENGHSIPVDFVSTGNNHHVAIYEDEKGNLQEKVVSFYEAVARVNQGLPIVDKSLNKHLGWVFKFTLKQNDMFLFPSEDFNPNEIDLFDRKNYKLMSRNLFRVQKIATKDYFFRHHLETTVEDNSKLKEITWKRLGVSGMKGILKVRTNHLGEIIHVGEQ
ncbi:type II CRISPR RNA-guided endonuclease Cas9 [Empedobacter brevis]|uniref:type II CRISPR RNA-guided endonuclease Cas9 n=1 Tax=Empedobacter brevis TaxID=247 RepID=UPI0023F1E55E|nr:type II CRISPR RNA-guided endonuclease Cas9 [Empedobacter brevis]